MKGQESATGEYSAKSGDGQLPGRVKGAPGGRGSEQLLNREGRQAVVSTRP